jgi:hypothetical protein
MQVADQLQSRQRNNGKLELHVAGASQHVDRGTAVNFENDMRTRGDTCVYASKLIPLPKRP